MAKSNDPRRPGAVRRLKGETFDDYAARVAAMAHPKPEGETRYQRVYREQLTRKTIRELREVNRKQNTAKRNRKSREAATQIDPDGRFRDNLGESPDY